MLKRHKKNLLLKYATAFSTGAQLTLHVRGIETCLCVRCFLYSLSYLLFLPRTESEWNRSSMTNDIVDQVTSRCRL